MWWGDARIRFVWYACFKGIRRPRVRRSVEISTTPWICPHDRRASNAMPMDAMATVGAVLVDAIVAAGRAVVVQGDRVVRAEEAPRARGESSATTGRRAAMVTCAKVVARCRAPGRVGC
jgi:hypothetical protein